jgi:hypothetical protein
MGMKKGFGKDKNIQSLLAIKLAIYTSFSVVGENHRSRTH